MMTLRSLIAYLATMIRAAGIAYVVVQVAIWHSFYTQSAWRLAAPALAVAWAIGLITYLRRNWPSRILTWVDSAAYVTLALGAQACVPPQVRDTPFSWLVIAMSGQLIVPAWYAPSALSVLLTLASPLAYLTGAELQPVTNMRMMTGAAVLLLVGGLVHGWGRRVLYGRATAADAGLDQADQAARAEYAVLRRSIERREHDRLLHDTILNTLTAVARGSGEAVAEVVTRCRQDVALMEAALGGGDDLAADSARSPGDLLAQVRAVVSDMRARGLAVHLDVDDAEADGAAAAAVPARVVAAVANAVREALSNVTAHAGTAEAWVSVRVTQAEEAEESAADPCRLRAVVRDRGAGFDLARVDRARLGLRRSITERAAECGGQASIWSRPGQGTEVSLCWPAPGPAGPALAAERGTGWEALPW
jgi:signal transduction histidine kinase